MKKFYSLLAFSFFIQMLNAQITLHINDFGVPGDSVVVGRDSLGSGIDVGAPGADLVWDFTSLQIHTYSYNHFGLADTTDAFFDFPEADVVYTSSSNTVYFDTSDNKIDILGSFGDLGELVANTSTGVTVNVPFDNPQTVLTDPTDYLDSFLDTTSFVKDVAGEDIGFTLFDSIRVVHYGYATVDIDAWGELLLWNESQDVLRRHRVEHLVDSVFVLQTIQTGNGDSTFWELLPPIPNILDANPRLDTLESYDWFAKNRDYIFVTANVDQGEILDVLFLIDSVLVLDLAPSNESCFNESDGSISLETPEWGDEPYVYLWSNASNDAQLTGLSSGMYSVTVVDAEGRIGIDSVTIEGPSSPVEIASSSINDATCYSCEDGSILINANGGTPMYTYTWSPNVSSTDHPTQISGGTYYVTVSDFNNCEAVDSFVVDYVLTISEDSVGNVNCFGNCDGMISVEVDGAMPISYSWSNGSTSNSLTGLCGDTLLLSATDANGKTIVNEMYIVTEPSSALVVNVDDLGDAQCAQCATGFISTMVSGGTADYSYSWSNGSTTEDLSDLLPGNYIVTVTDENGCDETQSFDVGAWPIGLADVISQNGFSFYPNPTKGVVFVSGATELAIYNILGEEVERFNSLNEKSDAINVESYVEGVYFISEYRLGKRMTSQKLIIKR